MGSVAYGDFTHEWFFTPTSMADLLRQAGLVNYQARGSDPYIHGPKSLVRAILWKVIKNFLKVWNIAETGSPGSGIYTRVFLATAVKS
jgi:hypothetical protein